MFLLGGIPVILCERRLRSLRELLIDLSMMMSNTWIISKNLIENGKKPKGSPRSLDWENARLLCKFLRLFYEATLRFSGSLIVTSNSYFHKLVGI
jgi:hypothetical protein